MSSQACNVHIEGSRSAIVALKSPDELNKDSRGHLRALWPGLGFPEMLGFGPNFQITISEVGHNLQKR